MTSVELITLYSDQISLFFTAITVQSTILFSFLVAMYFVAGKMRLTLVLILTSLFTAVSFGLVGSIYATGARAASIGVQLVSRINAPGSDISWLYPGVIPPDLPQVFFFFFIFAVLLSILFVFIRRRELRQVEISNNQ